MGKKKDKKKKKGKKDKLKYTGDLGKTVFGSKEDCCYAALSMMNMMNDMLTSDW